MAEFTADRGAVGLLQMIDDTFQFRLADTNQGPGTKLLFQVGLIQAEMLQVKRRQISSPDSNGIGTGEKMSSLPIGLDQVDDAKFRLQAVGAERLTLRLQGSMSKLKTLKKPPPIHGEGFLSGKVLPVKVLHHRKTKAAEIGVSAHFLAPFCMA